MAPGSPEEANLVSPLTTGSPHAPQPLNLHQPAVYPVPTRENVAHLSHRSIWQAEAVKQAPVSRFRTQAIKLGIAEHDNSHHALAEGLLEVIERAGVVADARERDREIVRRDVLMPRAIGQFVQKSFSLATGRRKYSSSTIHLTLFQDG